MSVRVRPVTPIRKNKMEKELEFLRYFYLVAGYAMGPADCDIYDTIKRDFLRDNGYLPENYHLDEEDE